MIAFRFFIILHFFRICLISYFYFFVFTCCSSSIKPLKYIFDCAKAFNSYSWAIYSYVLRGSFLRRNEELYIDIKSISERLPISLYFPYESMDCLEMLVSLWPFLDPSVLYLFLYFILLCIIGSASNIAFEFLLEYFIGGLIYLNWCLSRY